MIKSITAELHRSLAAKLFALDKWRVGQGAMVSYLRDFQKSQFDTLEQTRERQLKQVREIVAYAAENCPYYTNRFSQLGLSAESLQSLDDLASFPILEKIDIQQNQSEMISASWPKSDLIANHTGGSTGEPLPLYLNLDRRCQRDAGAWRHNEWAGARLGGKISYVWGAVFDLPTDSIKTRLRNWLIDRTLYLNSGDLTEQNMLEFYATLQRFRPASMIAYARSLALVARFFKQRGLKPAALNGIITSAETLSDDDRAVIEEVFQAKVFNRYGCREVSVIASECEQHDGLHTMAECLVVEVVDADGWPSPPGEMGSIVVTDLFNYAMPLIRYRVGDMGAIKAGECPCGRGLPMLERIEGRVTDFLVGKDGRLVSGVYVATYLIGKCPQLGRVQVLQESPGQLLFKVTGAATSDDAQFIVGTSKKMLGEDVEVEIEQVTEIPRTRSGKLVLCRSNATVDYLQTADSAGVAE